MQATSSSVEIMGGSVVGTSHERVARSTNMHGRWQSSRFLDVSSESWFAAHHHSARCACRRPCLSAWLTGCEPSLELGFRRRKALASKS